MIYINAEEEVDNASMIQIIQEIEDTTRSIIDVERRSSVLSIPHTVQAARSASIAAAIAATGNGSVFDLASLRNGSIHLPDISVISLHPSLFHHHQNGLLQQHLQQVAEADTDSIGSTPNLREFFSPLPPGDVAELVGKLEKTGPLERLCE
jgi:hypothetical protein